MNHEYLTANEVIKLLRIGKSTLFRWIRDGKLPEGTQLGFGKKAWRYEDIAAFIESKKAPDELLGTKEVAAMLGVGKVTLLRWQHAGIFPEPVTRGRVKLWRNKDIMAFLEERKSGAAPEKKELPDCAPDAMLGIAEVSSIVGAGRSTIYRWMRDGKFPKPKLTANSRKWTYQDVKDFLNK